MIEELDADNFEINQEQIMINEVVVFKESVQHASDVTS
jgi:hypothetical protein